MFRKSNACFRTLFADRFFCFEAMHPLLYYTLIAIVSGNALFVLYLFVVALREGMFKKRKAVPVAALEVQPSGKIFYVEFSEDGQFAKAPKHIGDLNANLGQAVLKQTRSEKLSPAELAAFIDVHGQSFWEKFPAPVDGGSGGKKAISKVG